MRVVVGRGGRRSGSVAAPRVALSGGAGAPGAAWLEHPSPGAGAGAPLERRTSDGAPTDGGAAAAALAAAPGGGGAGVAARRRGRRRRQQRAAAADDAEPALAPRGAKYRLEDVREAFKLSLAQFAQLLSTVQPVSQKLVQSWEAGLARVPMRILKRTEELSEQLAAEAAKAQPPPMEVVDLKAEYPYQEPMIGPDYQASVPRSCSAARNRREDEKVWCPKSAAKESVKVDAYLARVREALRGADGLQPSAACVEESALQCSIPSSRCEGRAGGIEPAAARGRREEGAVAADGGGGERDAWLTASTARRGRRGGAPARRRRWTRRCWSTARTPSSSPTTPSGKSRAARWCACTSSATRGGGTRRRRPPTRRPSPTRPRRRARSRRLREVP